MERNVKIDDPENSRVKGASRDNKGVLKHQAQPNILVKVQDLFFVCLRGWKWYILSFAVCFAVAYYQLRKTPNLYQRQASIMIKADETTKATSAQLKGLGIEVTPPNVSNEIMALTSTDVAKAVVKRLNLDMEYVHEGAFHNQVAYGPSLPATIKFHDVGDEEALSCVLDVMPDSSVIVSEIRYKGELHPAIIKMRLNQNCKTGIGRITTATTQYYTKGMKDHLLVTHVPVTTAAATVSRRMKADLRSKDATLIDISYMDYSISRAEDVLSTLVEVYNENWIKDQNRITQSTNEFIKERLAMIESELTEVENQIAEYKSENLMPNVESAGLAAVEKKSSAEATNQEIDNQIYMVGYLKDYIMGGHHIDQLLPANTGIGNQSIENQINEYNSIMLQRNGHLAHSSEQNPLVMDLQESLEILKESIILSLDNELTLLTNQKKGVETQHEEAIEQIAANPLQVTYVTSIERQQKVKESLYLFLLQKREENELSQAFAAYNSRLIEPPHGSYAPISPVPKSTYLLAFIIGFAVPTSIMVVKDTFNTVIRGRKDIEHLSIPFVGEIPLDSMAAKKSNKAAKERRKRRKKGLHTVEERPNFVVMEKSRNVMNEAFRVVRSNLEFILGFDNKHHVIMVTSLNPSSGKTFCSANLAYSLAINNKRVISVDLDMRKGTLSKYAGRPPRGVSNYLSGQYADYHELIVHTSALDILPCGTIPPNPTELLYTPQFTRMVNELSEEYDYVFFDCPPVEVVADAAIINRYVDMTLFVIRAQLLDRTFLPDLERWYEERRYNNLSVLLNGTTDAFSRYGYHKYGYRYGYHYGNYGYGYGNDSK